MSADVSHVSADAKMDFVREYKDSSSFHNENMANKWIPNLFGKKPSQSMTEFMCFILLANRFLNKVLNGIKTFYPVREQVSQRCYCFLFC